ncbi:hypothetical protein ACFW2Y_24410 [Streptomyces sp. NPDC058877]|uniref:hypothetical protein n=1 Tax=unclassified Streptomyces TaxID=2593676 RepID=UPI003677A000
MECTDGPARSVVASEADQPQVIGTVGAVTPLRPRPRPDLSAFGPPAEILSRCAKVLLVRQYPQRRSARQQGRPARPLTTRSPIR